MKCKVCNNEIEEGHIVGCAVCGATVCEKCRDSHLGICPYCYSNLEYIG